MAIPSGASVPVTEDEVDIGRLNGEDVISLAINLARESAAVKAVASHLGREANKACYMLVTWMSLKEAGEEVEYKGYKAVIPARMAPSDVMRMEFRPVAVHQAAESAGDCLALQHWQAACSSGTEVLTFERIMGLDCKDADWKRNKVLDGRLTRGGNNYVADKLKELGADTVTAKIAKIVEVLAILKGRGVGGHCDDETKGGQCWLRRPWITMLRKLQAETAVQATPAATVPATGTGGREASPESEGEQRSAAMSRQDAVRLLYTASWRLSLLAGVQAAAKGGGTAGGPPLTMGGGAGASGSISALEWEPQVPATAAAASSPSSLLSGLLAQRAWLPLHATPSTVARGAVAARLAMAGDASARIGGTAGGGSSEVEGGGVALLRGSQAGESSISGTGRGIYANLPVRCDVPGDGLAGGSLRGTAGGAQIDSGEAAQDGIAASMNAPKDDSVKSGSMSVIGRLQAGERECDGSPREHETSETASGSNGEGSIAARARSLGDGSGLIAATETHQAAGEGLPLPRRTPPNGSVTGSGAKGDAAAGLEPLGQGATGVGLTAALGLIQVGSGIPSLLRESHAGGSAVPSGTKVTPMAAGERAAPSTAAAMEGVEVDFSAVAASGKLALPGVPARNHEPPRLMTPTTTGAGGTDAAAAADDVDDGSQSVGCTAPEDPGDVSTETVPIEKGQGKDLADDAEQEAPKGAMQNGPVAGEAAMEEGGAGTSTGRKPPVRTSARLDDKRSAGTSGAKRACTTGLACAPTRAKRRRLNTAAGQGSADNTPENDQDSEDARSTEVDRTEALGGSGTAAQRRIDVLKAQTDEFKTVDKAPYRARSLDETAGHLLNDGIAIMRIPGLANFVSEKDIALAVKAASKHATSIFVTAEQDATGAVVYDKEEPERFAVDIGTGGRQQMPLAPHKRILSGVRECVEPLITNVANYVARVQGSRLQVNPPYLLINRHGPGVPPVEQQDLHTDLGENENGFVIIVPVQRMTLLVVEGSHHRMRAYWRKAGMMEAGTITEAQLVEWLEGASLKIRRLELDIGDLVFLDGHTVHAGDVGIPNHPSLRIHWYVVQGLKKDETHLLVHEHQRLLEVFGA